MPVIMMSDTRQLTQQSETTRIGALNFLEKPIALQKLLKAVPARFDPEHRTTTTRRAYQPYQRYGYPSDTCSCRSILATCKNFDNRDFSLGNQMMQNNQLTLVVCRSICHCVKRAMLSSESTLNIILHREGGSMTRVAEKTGLERTHLYRKLKQLGVESVKYGKRGE